MMPRSTFRWRPKAPIRRRAEPGLSTPDGAPDEKPDDGMYAGTQKADPPTTVQRGSPIG